MGDLQAQLREGGLAVGNDAAKGRCLVADRNFSPGQVVLEQDPYVAVLDVDSRGKRCDGCFKESSSLKRCSACKFVWYCSSTCQRAEWKIHNEECKVLVRLMNEGGRMPTPSLQLMLRLLIKRQLQAIGVVPTTAFDDYKIVQCLPTHFSESGEERLVLYAQMANLVKDMARAENSDIKEITENFCRFACNAHTICDNELRPLGTGLFPVVSIINHSCFPNAVLLFEGKRAIVRAIRNIKKGSEVMVSYVELGANRESRRKALAEQYFFYCNCPRCTEESKIDDILEGMKCPNKACEGLLRLDKDVRQWKCNLCGSHRDSEEVKTLSAQIECLMEKGSNLQRSGNLHEAKRAFMQVEKLQEELWHSLSMQLMRTRDTLLKINLCLEDWDTALKYCRLTIPAYEIAYPGNNHPLLGLQLYTLGKLEWHLGNVVEAVKALTRASDVLAVTHGSKGQFAQHLSSLLQEAQAEAAYRQS